MPVIPSDSGANGIAFLVGAGMMAEAVAKACSSPQTVEINIKSREPTMMKWVNIGLIEGTTLVLIAAAIDQKHAKAIIAGGLVEGLITWWEYSHGRKSGLNNPGPGTEDLGDGANGERSYGSQEYSQA